MFSFHFKLEVIKHLTPDRNDIILLGRTRVTSQISWTLLASKVMTNRSTICYTSIFNCLLPHFKAANVGATEDDIILEWKEYERTSCEEATYWERSVIKMELKFQDYLRSVYLKNYNTKIICVLLFFSLYFWSVTVLFQGPTTRYLNYTITIRERRAGIDFELLSYLDETNNPYDCTSSECQDMGDWRRSVGTQWACNQSLLIHSSSLESLDKLVTWLARSWPWPSPFVTRIIRLKGYQKSSIFFQISIQENYLSLNCYKNLK